MMSRSAWVVFLAVVLMHLFVLVVLLWAPAPPLKAVELPTITGVLILPPTVQVQAPPPEIPPPPIPPVDVPPPPKPAVSKAEPVKKLPPSKKAITQSVATPPPLVAAPPISSAAPISAPPIIPPRVDATQLNNPAPNYPAISRRLREQGVVLLNLLIQPDGSVGEIRIKQSSGFKRLDEIALETVKRWRYIPAKQGDTAIAYWYVQPIEFSLAN